MTKKTVTVNIALDTRKAAFVVQAASKYQSRVQLKLEDKCMNAKSIMGMVSLGLREGLMVDIIAEGIDEAEAVAEVAAALQ